MERPWIERADWAQCGFTHGPLNESERIEVRFNDGSTIVDRSEIFYWPDDGDGCDIAAYRLAD